jgi:XisI protein
MDTLESYRHIVQHVLTEYTKVSYAYGHIEFATIFDRASDRYALMTLGWEDDKRVHGCLLHIDIIDGKLWIQRDGTEQGIADDLVQAGIAKDRIVLGFHPADVRQHTEYAVA